MHLTALTALASVRADGAYALLDYPDHSNVGDVAIWLGTLALLKELNGREPAYVATLKHFDAALCRRLIGNGSAYFLGGGNLGDLYGKHHALRLAAIEALSGSRIVQLPQSLAWSGTDEKLLRATRRLYRGPERILFCRDQNSVRIAGEMLDLPAHLCPDLAFGIGPLERTDAALPVATLLRRDRERKRSHANSALPERDWRDSPAVMAWRRCGRLLDMAVRRLDRAGTGSSLRSRRMVACRKLAAGARFLDRGRFLITDRLHGHILAILLAQPHAVLDNTTGKNAAFLQSWSGGLSFVSLVEDVDAALAAAATNERTGR